MQKLASTIMDEARTQLQRIVTRVNTACAKMSTSESQTEYFSQGRDWLEANIAERAGTSIAAGAPTAGLLPMQKMASTIHGDARSGLQEFGEYMTAVFAETTNPEAQLQMLNETRDWFSTNIANLEGTRSTSGAGASAT
jgi:hypothetical protein